MKKVFTLLLFALAAFTFKTTAQITNCNASFTVQFLTNFTVKFTPAVADSPSLHHGWNYGDGSPVTGQVSPTHTYAIPGTYAVVHTVYRVGPNGTVICTQVITHEVTIQECNLLVDFSWSAVAGNPLSLEFHNLSVPLAPSDSVTWIFGDNTTSHVVNPLHTYANYGTYNVCLIVKKNNTNPNTSPCIKYTCKTVIIQAPCTLVADFNWTVSTTNPLMVEFHNLSTPLASSDSTTWTFGDGSGSFAQNPVHTYANAGTYTVCLRVKKNNSPPGSSCIRYICKTVIVTLPCTLVANFTWHPDSANAQKIYFTNTSVPLSTADSMRWTFGDGTASNQVNPYHIYSQAGTYTVCLRVQKRNSNGGLLNCVSEICKTVVVHENCNFQPSWTWHLDSANVKKVYFTNTTIAPSTAATAIWSFGDGTTASSWNAVHEYAQPGRYYVCLRIQVTPNCIRYKCDSITVPVPLPPCNNQSNFNFLRASTNSQTYTFTPDFQSSAAVYTWTFGDGTGSHDMIATHHYAQAGTYTACLTVWRSSTCTSTTCKVVTVTSQINCDSIHVSFTYQFDPILRNKVYFYAVANFPILDQTWTITRVGNPNQVILHQNNPAYIFPDTGYYHVCLRAVTLGGCIKEYCTTIHIEHVGTTVCQLQVYPNPASSVINVTVPLTQPEMINVYVYNTLNVLVKEKHQQGSTGNNVVTLSIGDLIAGIYTIRVVYGNHICYATFQKL